MKKWFFLPVGVFLGLQIFGCRRLLPPGSGPCGVCVIPWSSKPCSAFGLACTVIDRGEPPKPAQPVKK